MSVQKKLQLTLAILKPDVVGHPHIVESIRRLILENGLYILNSKMVRLSPSRAEEFYAEHRGKFFQNRLVCFMSSGPAWSHILCGDEAITRWRGLLGPTKVLKTVFEEPQSIRGRFGLTDTRNCAHGSDSPETAKREIEFFFPEFNVDSWYREEHHLFQQDLVRFDPDTFRHQVQSEVPAEKSSLL
ncbi:nucleoside diphosphate kinase 6 [Aplysia californica]|uniref:Nucleoside diphosphate kinase n=1 Tax=Aplysia californica TaxID=6500 RepID=A0ABM0K6Q2_APLCA|nr:nucleoside diphosphate kinase 6 [Aplysia californica]XP_012944374.1 nucleoside diphosphate kinase 6 [Aplysia californica]